MSDSILAAPKSTTQLGASGIEISSIGWGMWRFANVPFLQAARLVDCAIDSGLSFLDTADIYGFRGGPVGENGFGAAEALLGQVIAENPARRTKMVLATKAGITPPRPYDSSQAYLENGLTASLKRLNTDVIDLWQIHRPDILAHPQEVARALENAVTSGKVRAIGVSNYTLAQTEALSSFLSVPLSSTQPQISPKEIGPFEDGTLDQAMRLNLTPLAWSPLGGGKLASATARDKDLDTRTSALIAVLDPLAEAAKVSRSSLILSWLMAHPAGIVPIIGSQNEARIQEAPEALNVRWSRLDWYKVFVAAPGVPLP